MYITSSPFKPEKHSGPYKFMYTLLKKKLFNDFISSTHIHMYYILLKDIAPTNTVFD